MDSSLLLGNGTSGSTKAVNFLTNWATTGFSPRTAPDVSTVLPIQTYCLLLFLIHRITDKENDHLQSGWNPQKFQRNPAHVHRTATRRIPNDPIDNPPWQPQFWFIMSSYLQGNSTLPRNLSTTYKPTRRNNLADSLRGPIQSFGRTCNLHATRNILQPSHHF
jgi:hypothetical protein